MASTVGRTFRKYLSDQCTDLAAGLTYYSILALFPGLLAVVSLLGLVGEGHRTVDTLLDIIGYVGSDKVVSLLRSPIEGLVRSPAAPATFLAGVLGALWSASGYVGAFGRAVNRIYDVREGRPIWKLRPIMLGVTLLTVVLLAFGLLVLVSAPVAKQFGALFGVGDVAVTVLEIVQWPLMLIIAIVVVAVLYFWAPNVRQARFRWISSGAVLAIVVWIAASVGFGFYVSNFSNYNATYGSLGGVIVFLLWVWIANNALLFGAQFDAELERGRELRAGLHAEEDLLLPERDTRQIAKMEEQRAKDVLANIEIRQNAAPENRSTGQSE